MKCIHWLRAWLVFATVGLSSLYSQDVAETTPLAESEPVSQSQIEVHNIIDEVTVYRNQALVTHQIEASGTSGLQEILISNLPEHILPESLFAESIDPEVEVRSVRYRIRPVKEDIRPEIRQIDEKLASLGNQINATAFFRKDIESKRAYLAKLEEFAATTAKTDLSQGVLDAQTLIELYQFIEKERKNITDAELKLSSDIADVQKEYSLLDRQRNELTGGSAKTIREAVIFVNMKHPQAKLRLRYLVSNAGWSPSYNVRANKQGGQVHLEYFAAVQQMSGEDWNNVKMTLSTASPSLTSKAPMLKPLEVTISAPGAPINAEANLNYSEARQRILTQQSEINFSRSQRGALSKSASAPTSDKEYDFQLNALANDIQVLDLAAEGRVKAPSQNPAETEGVSVSYALEARNSLPSRSDRQLIQIASLPLEAEVYKLAVPVLTNYVYNEAKVANQSTFVFLPGPVTTYVDGQFVGRGELPLVAIGESFTTGLGIDPSLRAHRRLVEKSDSIHGGNRRVDSAYELSLENFGTEPANVRLIDRLPQAKNEELKVTLLSSSTELSDDALFQSNEKPKGILRWDVTVPAKAIGSESFKLEYRSQIEHDRQRSITGLPVNVQ